MGKNAFTGRSALERSKPQRPSLRVGKVPVGGAKALQPLRHEIRTPGHLRRDLHLRGAGAPLFSVFPAPAPSLAPGGALLADRAALGPGLSSVFYT